MNLNPASELVIISSMITIFLALFAWNKRSFSTSIVLFYILLAISIWSLFYGMELASTKITTIRTYLAIQYLGISTTPVFLLIFAAKYTKTDGWLLPLRLKLLFVIPLITVIMVATNSIHYLFYSISEVRYTEGYWFHFMEPGPFYWLHIVYSYILIFIGLVFFVRMYFKVEKRNRLKLIFIIFGAIVPYVVSIAYIAGFKPYGFLDTTPLGFILMGIVLTIGIFSVNLFIVNPLALDLLFDNIPDAIFVVDDDSMIVSANPSARTLLKMNHSTKKAIRHGNYNKELQSVLVDPQNDKDEVQIKGRIYSKTVKDVIDSKGEQLGKLLLLRDITESKRAEEALKESERQLREINATKDKFFSIIAHDLRNPFNSIVGFSSLLVDEVKQKDFSNIEEYSGIILDSSQRAMDLLNNLMEWSSSQTGRIEFKPEDIDLGSLINEVIELLSDMASRKSIYISMSVPENIKICADKHMVASILRNLISNAIKFTNKEGSIVVTTKKSDNQLQVSVADNGVGMNNEVLDKLFRIETCVVSTTGTENEKGNGLGLLLCKEFVERHGGRIWAESEPGKGSIFYFTFPL